MGAAILDPEGGLDAEHHFVVNDLGTFPDPGGSPRTEFVVGQAVKMYVGPGEGVYFSVFRSSREGACLVTVAASGQYVPAPGSHGPGQVP